MLMSSKFYAENWRASSCSKKTSDLQVINNNINVHSFTLADHHHDLPLITQIYSIT